MREAKKKKENFKRGLVMEDENNSTETQDKSTDGTKFPDSDRLSPLLNKKVYENRRKMAWLSLIAIILFTGLILTFVSSDKIDKYDNIIYYFYFTCASVVLGYMGSTSVSLIGNSFSKKK